MTKIWHIKIKFNITTFRHFNFSLARKIAHIAGKNLLLYIDLGGDYMIPVSRDEILSRFAGIPAV